MLTIKAKLKSQLSKVRGVLSLNSSQSKPVRGHLLLILRRTRTTSKLPESMSLG